MWTIEETEREGKHWIPQDRHMVKRIRNGYMALVCDGHGEENEAVDMVFKLLQEGFEDAEANDDLIHAINVRFASVAEGTRFIVSGSTALLTFLLDDGYIIAGVLGDSLLIIGDDSETVRIGPHHNARTNVREREAAIKRGGTWSYGYIGNESCGVQITRAFGNGPLYPIISQVPELYAYQLENPGWVGLMSDGVLDPASPDYASDVWTFRDMVRARTPIDTIVDHFYAKKEDDATLIIARWSF